MPSYKTKAVVLKTYNLGEADKIAKLFSGDSGLIDAVAKGARKIKSKFLGRFELFNFLELEITKGKSLDIVNQAETIKSFAGISNDFNKFIFCQFISDAVLKTHFSSGENPNYILKLIYFCLNEINQTEELYELKKIGSFFVSRFLKILGYVPNLVNCSLCKKNITQDKYFLFSIKFGGIICSECAVKTGGSTDVKKAISSVQYRLLNCLFFKDFKNLKELNSDINEISDVFKTLEDYLRFHAECNTSISSYLKRMQ